MARGKAAARTLRFAVTLSAPAKSEVSVRYKTLPGTALASSDYAARSGVVVIPIGQTSGVVNVPVNGDTTVESNETFGKVIVSW